MASTHQMRAVVLVLLLPALVPAPDPFPKPIGTPGLECKVKQLAYQFAGAIQPGRDLRPVADALGLKQEGNCTVPSPSRPAPIRKNSEGARGGPELFVDAAKGDDANPGTMSSPLRTIHTAVQMARQKPGTTIQLRKGVFRLSDTLELTAEDSGLTIQAYNNEDVEVSGGELLRTTWSRYSGNTFVAPVPGVLPFSGLRVNGLRAIRARWPNADPERALYPEGWYKCSAKCWAPPTPPPTRARVVNVTTPNRSDQGISDTTYLVGVGGTCEGLFDPPVGYWCNPSPPRGAQYYSRAPSGLLLSGEPTFPHLAHWRGNETVVHAFREGYWWSYAFLADRYEANKSLSWSFGGFHGGEGADSAEELYLENSLSLLDAPTEWYHDTAEEKLYYAHNGTGTPDNLQFEATRLKRIISIRGTQANPVRNVTIRGIRIAHAAMTLLDPHALPSDGSGDWAVSRTAAVYIEGTEGTTMEGCTVTRVDGNGVIVTRYNRNASLRGNEFAWIGESAMVSWGFTKGEGMPEGTGFDGTGGDFPLGTVVEGNVVREIGHFQKQVSCWFQAKSARTQLINNICFNGPRAGINFEDGFGGGNLIHGNLVFNMVRETQDHGTFNSWDRVPYLTTVRNGTASLVPDWNEIRHNLMINNYNPQEGIDNDDGSNYYYTHHNFFPFTYHGLKSDFGGHDNRHANNIYYTTGAALWDVTTQKSGHSNYFYNNTCILTHDGEYAAWTGCETAATPPAMHNNRVYTPNGKAVECGKPISYWQGLGHDVGTTVSTTPPDETILAWARQVLLM